MAFLIDTNVAVVALNQSDRVLEARLETALMSSVPVILSTIVIFELRYGAAYGELRDRNETRLSRFLSVPFVTAPFDTDDAEHAGDIRAHLRRIGRPIGPYDLLIAAQARRRDAVLVTANVREFGRVPGLRIENWAA